MVWNVLAAMCEPQIAIVSLTTMAAAYHSPATGQTSAEHPMIAADLQNPHQPPTAPAYYRVSARRSLQAYRYLPDVLRDNMPEKWA